MQYLACSHYRALRYYIESINSPCPYHAYPCQSYEFFQQGLCRNCPVQGGCPRMGYHVTKPTSEATKGMRYYSMTNENYPFCGKLYWHRLNVIVKCGFKRISWHVSFYHCVKKNTNTHTFVRKFMLVLLKCIEILLQLIYNKMSLGLRRFFKDGRRSPDWCIPGNIVCVAGHLIIFKTTHLSFFIDYDQHTITRLSFTQDLVS